MSKLPFSKPPILIAAVLGVLIVAGVFIANSQGVLNLQNPVSPQSEENLAAMNSCPFSKEVCTYFIAQSDAMKSGVTITSTSDDPEAKNLKTVIKMDGSQNSSVESYQEDKLISHMITYEQVVYFLNPEDNTWYSLGAQQQDNVVSTVTAPTPTEYFEEAKLEGTEISLNYIGDEPCGKEQCKKYEFISSENTNDEDGESEPSQIFIWINPKTKVTQQMELITEQSRVFLSYEYGPVEISMPSPVGELPSFGGMDQLGTVQGVTEPTKTSVPGVNETSPELMLQFQEGETPSEQEINQFIRELQQ